MIGYNPDGRPTEEIPRVEVSVASGNDEIAVTEAGEEDLEQDHYPDSTGQGGWVA